MKLATMFLRDITCLDHAVIQGDGTILGGSYHVDIDIEGRIDEQEQVIIDFSAVKKLLKVLIDHPTTGYDHKLWVIPGYSQFTLSEFTGGQLVETPALNILHAPNSVLKFKVNWTGSLKETVERELQLYLMTGLREALGDAIHSVAVKVNENPFKRHLNHVPFRYVHGLKDSSSYGCQSLSHGHLSFIEWSHSSKYKPDCFSCQAGVQHLMQAISYLDGAVLVKRENIVSRDDKSLTIRYDSLRGEYQATYNTEKVKIVVMDCETTIENIIGWFADHFKGALEMAHVDQLYISEGLSKGATVHLGF